MQPKHLEGPPMVLGHLCSKPLAEMLFSLPQKSRESDFHFIKRYNIIIETTTTLIKYLTNLKQ